MSIASLDAVLNYREQVALQTTLEIHGLPNKPNEDRPPILESVAKAPYALFAKDDLLNVYRICKTPSSNPLLAPIIIAKLSRQFLRDKIVRQKKTRLLNNEKSLKNEESLIFIREALTPINRRIYASSLDLKRPKKVKYLWISGGKSYCRKEDGTLRT